MTLSHDQVRKGQLGSVSKNKIGPSDGGMSTEVFVNVRKFIFEVSFACKKPPCIIVTCQSKQDVKLIFFDSLYGAERVPNISFRLGGKKLRSLLLSSVRN